MAPVLQKTITHLAHPKHSLKLNELSGYTCDGCKIHGTGKRYHCNNGCDFDLHGYCGTCPMTLFSFMHPNHQLELVVPGPQAKGQLERICNICSHSVKGMFYRCDCERCEFDVHPLCTQYPETLRHVLHQVHPLKLSDTYEPGRCAVCREACNTSSWRYRCAPCGIDIHLGCENKTIQPYVPPPQNWNGNYYGSPSNMQHVPWSPQHYPNQPQQVVPNRRRGGGGILGRVAVTFGVGAISNIIFGGDILSPIVDMI